MKTITFAIPCYNSAAYMDTCIESILACDDGRGDMEIVIVDDGSTKDETPQKADDWAARYPGTIIAVHQKNGGHGAAVNTGLANARGRYFKVVDSDDWVDKGSLQKLLPYLRRQAEKPEGTDLVIVNYVYEKVHEGTHTTIDYRNVFPVGREFTWNDVGHFKKSQYLLMHSVFYRTDLLREIGLKLPEHCFYVDNIFVYVPLPAVKTMYYLDVDLYRYFIGREDQSVNESVMLGRIDQQLRVTRFMIDAVDLATVENQHVRKYMENYLSMMMCICSVFLRMNENEESERKRDEIWEHLRTTQPETYPHVRKNVINVFTNLPGEFGRKFGLGGYHLAQKIFKFN